jgi:hypothetical protein
VDYSRVNGESVAWAFQNAANLLQGELDQVRSLNERAAQLAGFSGVVLAILGSLAGDGFASRLGSVGEGVFATFYFGSAFLLAASIIWLVLLVHRPTRWVAMDPEEIRNYVTDERLLRAEPWALQIRMMRTIYPAALWARKGAAQLKGRIGVGAGLFAGGLTSFLGAVITLGLGSP